MADLVTVATIKAHDMLTGPLMAMASKIASVNNQVRSSASSAQASASSTVNSPTRIRKKSAPCMRKQRGMVEAENASRQRTNNRCQGARVIRRRRPKKQRPPQRNRCEQ